MAKDPSPIFDFEAYLKSDELAANYKTNKQFAAVSAAMGSLSVLASVCIIVHILRSHHGLTTTYHRLVFGLSIGDIIFSFFIPILEGTMVPKEYDYIVPSAMGNQGTCDAQGFLGTFGSGMALAYNCSICFYYLAIITFNKNDDYIRKKLEPWLHRISIFLPLVRPSMTLAIDGFNTIGGSCWFIPNREIERLPHCMGLENGEIRDGFTIPCGRGEGNEHPILYRVLVALSILFQIITPVVIVVTMAFMYRTVRKVEKKMQKYGAGSLSRLRNKAKKNNIGNQKGNANITSNSASGSLPHRDEGTSENNSRRFILFPQWLKTNLSKIPCNGNCRSSGRSNSVSSQKRAILHRAVGYGIAWGLAWMLPILFAYGAASASWALYITVIFFPLQGVFNFLAYMQPKVTHARKGPKRRSMVQGGERHGDHANANGWCRSFVKAYTSRGPKKKSGQRDALFTIGVSWKNNRRQSVFGKLRASMVAFSSIKKSVNSSKDGLVTTTQEQEIRHPPSSGQGKSVLFSEDVAGSCRGDCEGGQCHLNRNDTGKLSNNSGTVDDVYFSEEIQSSLG